MYIKEYRYDCRKLAEAIGETKGADLPVRLQVIRKNVDIICLMYRVSHIITSKNKWLWWVEGSKFLTDNGA